MNYNLSMKYTVSLFCRKSTSTSNVNMHEHTFCICKCLITHVNIQMCVIMFIYNCIDFKKKTFTNVWHFISCFYLWFVSINNLSLYHSSTL